MSDVLSPAGSTCHACVTSSCRFAAGAVSQNSSPPSLVPTILFFIATTTAVMCSQALPAMGSTMIPRKAWLSPVCALNSSILPHRNLQAQHGHKHTHTTHPQGCHLTRRCVRCAAARHTRSTGHASTRTCSPSSCSPPNTLCVPLLVTTHKHTSRARVFQQARPAHQPTHSEHTATATVMPVSTASEPGKVIAGSSSSSSALNRSWCVRSWNTR